MLNQQRRQANGAQGGDSAPAAPQDRAAPAPPTPPAPAGTSPEPRRPPPNPAATGLSAMEKALGVPGVAPPEVGPQPAQAGTPGAIGGEIEIEGQRYSQAQLREYVLKATDYTQKTQQLAQQAQQLAAQQQALATVLPYIQPELSRLAESLQRAEAAQMPDPALAHTDPTSYVQQRAAYDAAVAEQQRLGSLTTLQQQAHERAMAQQVAQANQQLAAEYPFWADPAQRLEAQQQIVEWATNKGGFTRDELRGLADPRHLKLMMKAAVYDKWVEGSKTTAPTPTLAAPPRGTPPPPPPTARLAEAQTRFDARPDFRSGAALLGALRASKQQGR